MQGAVAKREVVGLTGSASAPRRARPLGPAQAVALQPEQTLRLSSSEPASSPQGARKPHSGKGRGHEATASASTAFHPRGGKLPAVPDQKMAAVGREVTSVDAMAKATRPTRAVERVAASMPRPESGRVRSSVGAREISQGIEPRSTEGVKTARADPGGIVRERLGADRPETSAGKGKTLLPSDQPKSTQVLEDVGSGRIRIGEGVDRSARAQEDPSIPTRPLERSPVPPESDGKLANPHEKRDAVAAQAPASLRPAPRSVPGNAVSPRAEIDRPRRTLVMLDLWPRQARSARRPNGLEKRQAGQPRLRKPCASCLSGGH